MMRGRAGDPAIGLGAQPDTTAQRALLDSGFSRRSTVMRLGADRSAQPANIRVTRRRELASSGALIIRHLDHGGINEDLSRAPLTTVVPYQSDFALNSLAVFVIGVLYVASQQEVLSACWSWTRTGVVRGSAGSWRLAVPAFT